MVVALTKHRCPPPPPSPSTTERFAGTEKGRKELRVSACQERKTEEGRERGGRKG